METNVNNVWQFLTLVAIPALIGLTKYWINKSDEREAKRAEERGAKRDIKFSGMEHEIEKVKIVAVGVGNSLDEFKKEHQVKEENQEKQLKEIGERVFNIEKNLISREEFFKLQSTVHSVDKCVVEIATMLKERTKALA
jgi:Tfp pilus assembly protein PilO